MDNLETSWSPFAASDDTAAFLRLVDVGFQARRLAFTGTPPVLVSPDGKEVHLENVARRCAALAREEWSEVVGEFLDTIAQLMTIEDPLAMSADVARASLRLRLGMEPVPGDEASGGGATPDPESPLAVPLRRAAMPGAAWMLYLRIPGGGVAIAEEHLSRWGIGVEEAWQLAHTRPAESPGPRSRRVGDVRILEGSSMFTHTALLNPRAIMPIAPDGWFLAVPSREQVVVTRAQGTEAGIRRFAEMLRVSHTEFCRSGYPLTLSPWFVPPTGMGPYGEDAERIELRFDRVSGELAGVRFGPLVHELFGEESRFA